MKLIKSELNWNQNGIVLDTTHMAPKYENKEKKSNTWKFQNFQNYGQLRSSICIYA